MTSDWQLVTIGEIAKAVTKGSTPTSIGGRFTEKGIPFVKVETLSEQGGFLSGKFAFIDEKTDDLLKRSRIQPNDVLFSIAGTIGRVALVGSNSPSMNTNQAIAIVRPDQSLVDPRFLYFSLRDKDKIKDAKSRVVQSVQANFSLGELKSLELLLPPPKEQKAIAHILGALDSKIEINRISNETLEGISKALFVSWFIDFDPVRAKAEGRPTGLPDEISELFPGSFEESELGEIPKGWVQTSIGKEASLLTGFPFKSALFSNSPPGVRLARGMNVKEGFLFWESQSRYWSGGTEEYKKYFLDVGDILIGMDGSKVGKNWVRVRAADLPCLLVQRVARLRHESSVGETFLRFLVGSNEFTAYVDLVKTGTSIPHISLKQIKEYAFVRPEKSDNRLFTAYEEISLPMMRKVDNNCAQSIVLVSLRDYLLPRLISGELRVPDAEKMLEEAGV